MWKGNKEAEQNKIITHEEREMKRSGNEYRKRENVENIAACELLQT